MKMKNLIYILLACVTLVSCADDACEPGNAGHKAAYTMRIDVEGFDTATATRSVVPAEKDEDKVQSLYLLFFESSDIAKGKFKGHYSVPSPISMSQEVKVPQQAWMEDGTSYNVLALANLNTYEYLDGDIDLWLAQVQNLTEKQAYDFAVAGIFGVSGPLEQEDNSRLIKPGELLMSARTSVGPDQRDVEITLQRALTRFDVHNRKSDLYDLVSVSVWNAARYAPIWPGTAVKEEYVERFYGVKTEHVDPNDSSSQMKDVVGGLYAFENFVDRTSLNDKITTCLILGISPRADSGLDNPGVTTYYRVNVNADDGASQNLYRNHVYKINIFDVVGPGAVDERDAWTMNKNNIVYDINIWDQQYNGLVLVDENNTLVLPAKRIIMDPNGETRELAFLTFGEGKLALLKNQCPDEFGITLDGNLLTVEAARMNVNDEDRRGTIEVGLNNLRATIDIIQTKNKEKYLMLNKSVVPSFPSTGVNMIPGGHIEVISSGPWKAKIVNNSSDPVNPGFSFNPGGAVDLDMDQSEAINDMFQIYTTGNNDSPTSRYGFLMVWLEEDEDYNQSLVLMQRPAGGLTILPDMESIIFSATGMPPVANNPSIADGITFQVNPGDDNGTLNDWHVELEGNDKVYFDLTQQKDLGGSAATNTFTIKAIGTGVVPDGSNTLERSLSLGVKIWRDNPESGEQPKVVPITQASYAFRLSTSGGSVISVRGGTIEIKVNADESLKWSARIATNSLQEHQAFIVDGQNKVTEISGRSMSETITLGYPKLLTPNVNVTPQAVLEVMLDGTDLVATYEFSQEMLVPKQVDILNIRDGWGQLISADVNEGYRNFIRAASLYGPTGVVRTAMPGPRILSTHYRDRISPIGMNSGGVDYSNVWFINANRTDGISQQINDLMRDWRVRTNNEGIIVFINDNATPATSSPWTNGNLLADLGYRRSAVNKSTERHLDNSSQNTKVWDYLMKSGPFTDNQQLPAMTFYADGINTSVDKAQLPAGAVPVIICPNTDEAALVIDPVRNVIFIGEIQLFQSGFSTALSGGKLNGNKNKFLGNLIAYIINAAQYGSHFTDNYID